MPSDPLVNIGFVAARTGTAVSAIRYYEEQGLIPSIRNNAGHRMFHRSVIRRVSFILIAQNLGYSLTQISHALATLPENRTPTKKDWSKLSRQFSQHIQDKIQRLQNLQQKLDGCIGCGCLSLQNCQLYNPHDKANSFGPGARYLLGDKPK